MATLAAAALAAPAAGAAGAPGCPLVTDPAGDAYSPGGPAAGAADLDLLTADVWADARQVTATVRVAALPPTANPSGGQYRVTFTVTYEERFELVVNDDPTGTTYVVQTYAEDGSAARPPGAPGSAVYASGRIDRARGEITISAPLTALRSQAPLRRGMQLREVTVRTGRWLGTFPTGGAVVGSDSAYARRPVTVGAPRCAGR